VKERNYYGGKLMEGKNTFNVCDQEIYIKHAMLLQLDKILTLYNDNVPYNRVP